MNGSELSGAFDSYSRLQQINQMLAALAAGTAAVTSIQLSIGGGPSIQVPISPAAGDPIYARITTILTNRQTFLQNQLAGLGVTL